MSNIIIEDHNNVAVIRLTKGVTNTICPAMVSDLGQTLDQVEGEFQALVLAGGKKFFSMGLDLPTMLRLDREEMGAFWQLFDETLLRLFTLSMPTASAIYGHATAGGTIMALTTDFRFIAEGRRLMGLNEIQLGLPVPYLADLMLRHVVGDRTATRMTYTGQFLEPDEAKKVGLVDDVFAEDDLENQVVEQMAQLGSLKGPAFDLIKEGRTEGVQSIFKEKSAEKIDRFFDCWFHPQVQAKLHKAAEKF